MAELTLQILCIYDLLLGMSLAITRPDELKVEDTEGLRYEIKLDNTEEVYDDIPASQFGSDGVTYFWFRDLEPETKYHIEVSAYNDNGKGAEAVMDYENTAGNFVHKDSVTKIIN